MSKITKLLKYFIGLFCFGLMPMVIPLFNLPLIIPLRTYLIATMLNAIIVSLIMTIQDTPSKSAMGRLIPFFVMWPFLFFALYPFTAQAILIPALLVALGFTLQFWNGKFALWFGTLEGKLLNYFSEKAIAITLIVITFLALRGHLITDL